MIHITNFPRLGKNEKKKIILPPWGSRALWKEAGDSINYLINQHKNRLTMAFNMAEQLKGHLKSIFFLLDELCYMTCPWCPDSCCLKATVWMDFKDLLFLDLAGEKFPPAQLIKSPSDTCRYLGQKGCILPRIKRPWICTLYLCPTQNRILRRESSKVQKKISQAVQTIKTGRKKIEDEFIRITTMS